MWNNLVRREALPQFGNQQSSTSMCYFAFQAFPCPASSTSAAQVARPTSADVTSAAVPMGTGAISTSVVQGWFGQSSTVVGRIVDIQTTDQFGRQSTIEAFSAPGLLVPVTPQTTAGPSSVSRLATSSIAPMTTSNAAGSSSMASSATSSPAATGLANAADGTTQTAVPQTTSHGGLSTGALVAAVVIPIVVVLLLLGLGACCFVRRRRRQPSFKYGDEFTPRTSSRGKLFGGVFKKKQHSVAGSNHSGHAASSSGEVTLASRGFESSQKSFGPSHVLPAVSVPASGAVALSQDSDVQSNQYYDSEKSTPGSDPFTDRHAPVPAMAITSAEEANPVSQRPVQQRNNNSFLIPRRSVRGSANATGRTSLDDDDETRSAFSDSEYHDAELGNAAVGVAQRASVINMIVTGNGNRSSGRGSTGSQSTQGSNSASTPKAT